MVKKEDVLSKTLEENLKKPGRNSKNLEEIQKTWRKFTKNLWPPCYKYIFAIEQISVVNKHCGYFNESKLSMYES